MKTGKLFFYDQDQDKDAHSCHFYSSQYWKPSQSNWARIEIKCIEIRKAEEKLSLFEDGMLLYVKTLKNPPQNC